jgi:uncharacterized membrane protein
VILRRVLLLIAAAAALMAATGVITIAIAFAVYAAFEPMIGRAYAAAATAGVFAAAIALTALVLGMLAQAGQRRRAASRSDASLTDRIMDLIREKPFAAAGIAAAAGLVAIRNPRIIGAVLGAFLEGWRGGAAAKKRP